MSTNHLYPMRKPTQRPPRKPQANRPDWKEQTGAAAEPHVTVVDRSADIAAEEASIKALSTACKQDSGKTPAQIGNRLDEIERRIQELNEEVRTLTEQASFWRKSLEEAVHEEGSRSVSTLSDDAVKSPPPATDASQNDVIDSSDAEEELFLDSQPQPEQDSAEPETQEEEGVTSDHQLQLEQDADEPEAEGLEREDAFTCDAEDEVLSLEVLRPAEENRKELKSDALPQNSSSSDAAAAAEDGSATEDSAPDDSAVEFLILGEEDGIASGPDSDEDESLLPELTGLTGSVDSPSAATLEIELEGLQGILCKKCKKKFADPGPEEIIKECPYCETRFYANFTYELRMVDNRAQRKERRRRRQTFRERMEAHAQRPIRESLSKVYGLLGRSRAKA